MLPPHPDPRFQFCNGEASVSEINRLNNIDIQSRCTTLPMEPAAETTSPSKSFPNADNCRHKRHLLSVLSYRVLKMPILLLLSLSLTRPWSQSGIG